MSREDLELIRSLYRFFNEGTGSESVPDLWHSDVELRPALIGGGVLEGAVYRGHQGVLEFLAMQAETWEKVTIEPVEVRKVGKYHLVETRLRAVGRVSGVELTAVTWNRWEIRSGKVASLHVFTKEEDALEG